MKVYTDPGNFQTLKVMIAANLTNTKIQIAEVKHSDHVPPYLVRSKLPVLEVADGKFLFAANTIAKYFYLRASKISDEEAEDGILDWECSELLPVVAAYLVSAVGHGKKEKHLHEQLLKVLQQLDSKVSKTKYLSGDSLSLCDVCVFSTVYPLLGLKNLGILEKLSNLHRWCNEVQANSTVQDTVSKFMGGKGQELFKASLIVQSFPPLPTSATPGGHVSSGGAKTPAATNAPSSVSSEDQIPVEKVPAEELEAALKAWKTDPKKRTKPRDRKHPILPEKNSRNVLILSALPYVNNVPHLGNIIGCVLSADVFSRFARLRNYNALYISGTDEYGTATETKAMEEGVSPKEICDKYNKLHKEIYEWFNIDFDHFGRTSTKQQTERAQELFWKLYNGGYILKDSIDQLKCTKCNKFLADRFVEGICPLCGYDDARGDQCDGCGKLINANELLDPKCKMCKSAPVIQNTQHLFIDLPKLEPILRSQLDKVMDSGTWTNNAKVITNTWLRDGLKPRCISRDLKWGIPVPLEGYTDKVFYVWYDAPIGYISMTSVYTDKWEQWWKNPENVEIYHFLGKDNVPFHSVIFPSCLLGANDGYTVGKHMIATEYLNYEDTKFSKSRGTGVFGNQAKDTGIPADVFRFYLLYVRPESQDTAFSWDDFLLKNNSELLNNLGNFINRGLMFVSNNFGGEIQEIGETEDDLQLLALIARELRSYVTNLDACRLRDGIRNILTISRLGNQYMQANKPWVLAKGSPEEKKRAGSVVSLCANVACLLSVLLQPYMPSVSATIQEQLKAPPSVNVITGDFVALLSPGHKIGKPSPLFQKIEASVITDLKAKFAGKPDDKAASKNKKNQGGDVKITASPEEIEKLTKAVAEQGDKVRTLKTAKAEKALIDKEVATLLELKRNLAQVQGPTGDTEGKGGKKGGKGSGGKKPPVNNAVSGEAVTKGSNKPVVDGAAPAGGPEVERLTQAVADQGNKVREVKAAKADKSVIDAEVASLLKLKRELAIAQGQDPDAATGGSKKSKKKK